VIPNFFLSDKSIMATALVATALLMLCSSMIPASAQDLGGFVRYTDPVVGGTRGGSSAPPAFPMLQNTITPRFSADAVGKPCVTINAISQPQIINPALYTHILIIRNGCARQIKLKVCYYKTDQCLMMAVDAYRREQRNLGIFPAKDFQFEYREAVM
jgi:hypothetical protein